MEQQQPVRRLYIGKQRPRPSQFVPVCQPLAAQQFVPVSPPLAAEPHQPKRKRTQTGTRVQLAGQRLSCSVSLRGALMARLRQERASRETWTGKQWEHVVQQVAKEDWGAVTHGGCRTRTNKVRPPAVGEQQAVSDQAQVDHDSIISVGEAKSAVGQDESSATGKEQREEGQVAHAASAVGEEHASEQDKDSVIAECGTPHALPSVLPTEPTTLTSQRLAGYTVLEFIANGSYGDVYKASKKSTGELFAVKVMTKCRKTAKMTTEQRRELSLMRGLSRKHDHVVNLLGWRETCFNVQLFMPLYDQTLRQYIRGHSVPLYAGSTIVKQLSSAVAYLHDCNILHRDIKPPNILVKRQPLAVGQPLVVALSDFGSSREILPLGLDQAPEQPMTPKMVTVYYRAPEILMGQTYALPSDVWSTGITFVEVEQGHPPFQIETEFKLVREIFKTVGGRVKNLELCKNLVKQSARKWGEKYGGEFQALVDSMLVCDPDDRISSRVAARRGLAWWRCSQPLAGSVQPSSSSQHTQPLAGPPLAA